MPHGFTAGLHPAPVTAPTAVTDSTPPLAINPKDIEWRPVSGPQKPDQLRVHHLGHFLMGIMAGVGNQKYLAVGKGRGGLA